MTFFVVTLEHSTKMVINISLLRGMKILTNSEILGNCFYLPSGVICSQY